LRFGEGYQETPSTKQYQGRTSTYWSGEDPSTELKGEPQVYLNTRQVEVHTHLVLSCTGRRLEKPVPVKRK